MVAVRTVEEMSGDVRRVEVVRSTVVEQNCVPGIGRIVVHVPDAGIKMYDELVPGVSRRDQDPANRNELGRCRHRKNLRAGDDVPYTMHVTQGLSYTDAP